MSADLLLSLLQQHVADIHARSLALRDAVALLIAREAGNSADADQVFREVASALQDRLDELPEGVSDLKEKVRAEADWLVSAAQAFHNLRKS